MSLKDKLPTPNEPKKVKEQIKDTRFHFGSHFGEESDIDLDSMAVWFGNTLPKYLWNEWKPVLKEAGLTWPKFLKLLKYNTNFMIRWAKEKISWEELIQNLKRSFDEAVSKI